MKNVKKNNKGFSLVELIVVIAVMGILAVTLAPRLMHYVEKTRVASDQEVAHTVLTAAKLAYLQYPDEFDALDLADGTDDGRLDLAAVAATPNTAIFVKAGKTWTHSDYEPTNDFAKEIRAVVDGFTFKSNAASEASNITIVVTGSGANAKVGVELDFDGIIDTDASNETDTYTKFE